MAPLSAFVFAVVLHPPLRTGTIPAVEPIPLPPHTAQLPERERARSALSTGRPLEQPGALELNSERQREGALSGEYLVQPPNVFRGLSANGQMLEPLRILRQDETSQLIQDAWFFLSSGDARRQLMEAETFDPTHEQIVHCMRARSAAAVAALRKSSRHGQRKQPDRSIAARAVARTCQQLMPEAMCNTEFRLRESVGRSAYNKLFLHHQRLIYAEVNKLLPGWQAATVTEKADFLQEGAQGLLRAIRLFDMGRSVQFSTYAVWHIRAYVLRAVRDKGRLVRLPQKLQADMCQIRKARYRYAVENQGHVPSAAQLARLLEWTAERVAGALEGLASCEMLSLDAASQYGASSTGGPPRESDFIISRVPSVHGCAAAETALYQQQLEATIRKAQCARDPKRARMTRLKYGLEDGQEWTYPQLAKRFNITANGAKSIVRSEVAYLRRQKRGVLRHFVH